jgi:hypothetical protein
VTEECDRRLSEIHAANADDYVDRRIPAQRETDAPPAAERQIARYPHQTGRAVCRSGRGAGRPSCGPCMRRHGETTGIPFPKVSASIATGRAVDPWAENDELNTSQ